jgi:hypothetical protein
MTCNLPAKPERTLGVKVRSNTLGPILGCLLFCVGAASGQSGEKLANVITNVASYPVKIWNGPDTVVSTDPVIQARIQNPANYRDLNLSSLVAPINTGIAIQLSALPIASPASAIIFRENVATGALLPSRVGLGPILTERAETMGKGKFFMGYTRQQFRFNKLDGRDLGNISGFYAGGEQVRILNAAGQARVTAPMTTNTYVDLRLDQNVAFFTYGVTDRLDISAALTVVDASVSAIARNAQIGNTGVPAEGGNCWCVQTFNIQESIAAGGRAGFSIPGVLSAQRRTSTGLGDTLVRVKQTLFEGSRAALAIGGDLRLPTGDEMNYRGSGAIGFKPFVSASLYTGEIAPGFRIAPHFNFGYQVSGSSILAGDPLTGRKERLPDQLNYAVGAEVAIRGFTGVVDYLSNVLFDAPRLVTQSGQFLGRQNVQLTGETLGAQQTFSMNNLAVGFKVKAIGNLVLTANTLIALNDNGLRDKVVPLFGISYTLP